jgi:DNA gyrase subunit A
LILVSEKGYIIKFNTDEITPTGRLTAGVKGINLGEGDSVIAALPVRHSEDDLAIFSSKGYGKRMKLSELPSQKRGGKGVVGYKENNISGYATAAQLVNDDDMVLLVGNKTSICISARDIPISGRVAMGNMMLKDNKILSVSKV